MQKRLPTVLVIGTGGRINAKKVGNRLLYGEYIQEETLQVIPEIREHVKIRVANLFRMHSADMHPDNWVTLSQFIYYHLPEVDGVVVTHGTDTLAYSAAAMAFMIQKLNVPIVFTGSHSSPSIIGGDAQKNLIDAIRTAAAADLAESVIVFNKKIIRGVRAKSINATLYDGFDSISQNKLGVVERGILLEGFQKKRNHLKKPVLLNNLENNVGVVKIYPGISAEQLESAVDTGLTGIVMEGYGLGNIPMGKNNLKPIINNLMGSGVPVVLTSDSALGPGWQNIYLQEMLDRVTNTELIECYDMTTETALVKLMWVLGQTKKMSKVRKMMHKNYVGEISTNLKVLSKAGMWERKL